MLFPLVSFLIFVASAYPTPSNHSLYNHHAVECGEYDMQPEECIYFGCSSSGEGTCLNIDSSYFPEYFTTFRASIAFMKDYTYRLRLKIFAYEECNMPIFDLDAYVYKPLLRNSTMFTNGTYIDSEIKNIWMTPLRDNLTYDLTLDCKEELYKDKSFEVLYMNAEIQMCMYDFQGAEVDLFGMIRRLIGIFSPEFDVDWIDQTNIRLSNELLGFVSSSLNVGSMNMTRISDDGCKGWEV